MTVTKEMIEAALEAYAEGVYLTDEQVFASVISIVEAALPFLPSRSAEAGKPVAWRWQFDEDGPWSFGVDEPNSKSFRFGKPDKIEPLYAAPAAYIEPVSVPYGQRPDNLVATDTGMLVNGHYIYALEVALSVARIAAAPQPASTALVERLTKALTKLEREASEFSKISAEPGTQWTRLSGALIDARSTLAELKAKSPSSDRAASEADTSDFMHRLIENAFSWAVEDANYLDPKATGRLIEATRSGMKPEEASEWRSDLPEILARKAALAAQGDRP